MGLYLRSVEMVVVMLFGLTLIAVIAAKDVLKGLIAGFFGLLIGVIGADHIYSTPRATFGFLELYDGVPLVPALIGLFAISRGAGDDRGEDDRQPTEGRAQGGRAAHWAGTIEALRYSVAHWWQIVWTAFVGLFIGIVPGAGATHRLVRRLPAVAHVVQAPRTYGTGDPDGVIARRGRRTTASTSGTLVPMIALGVPGGSTAAVMMIVLQYHGMVMGPRLFADNPRARLRRVRLHGAGLRVHDPHHPSARALHVAHRADRDQLPGARSSCW